MDVDEKPPSFPIYARLHRFLCAQRGHALTWEPMHDRLRGCVEDLRVFSMRSRNPDLVSLIERRIDEFALGEVPRERTALERLAQVIEMLEARKQAGEDWTVAKEYVRSLLQKLA